MSQDHKKSIDPAVLAAIITVAGGIIITLISTFGNKLSFSSPTPFPTWTIVPTATITGTPVPTDTVAAGEPTSTPAPDTPTPEPSATPPPPQIGSDWVNACISALWKPFPELPSLEEKDGCYVGLVGPFFTTNGHLAFAVNERASGSEFHGLFAQLPADGIVSLNFHLGAISKGSVVIGIFAAPSTDASGALLVIPSGKDINSHTMLLRTMPDNKTFAQSNGPVSSSSATYDVTFDFNTGSVNVKLKNNQINLGTINVVSTEKWLFIGYQEVNGPNNLQADFFDLAVQPR